MANKPTGSITLPLLDRLTDEDPKRREEVPLSRSKSLAALKVAVRRDLEWLLNTRRAERELPPQVARSVFCLRTAGAVLGIRRSGPGVSGAGAADGNSHRYFRAASGGSESHAVAPSGLRPSEEWI